VFSHPFQEKDADPWRPDDRVFIPRPGKESIIPIGIGLGIPWWLMVLTLTLLDVVTSLFMIMNFASCSGFHDWSLD